ncbi:MAG: hypothetical protein K8F91_11665 [Candidatus Obscuribacterales bacterium]|nr:hypothetical protein [Candidatus Obscuribacterales bacterium]
MTDQAELFKPKEVTPLDSKVREASEVEAKEAGLHNQENKKIHDKTQARHKIGGSATDLMIPKTNQESMALIDPEKGIVYTGSGMVPMVPEDSSRSYAEKLKSIKPMKTEAELEEKKGDATLSWMKEKGLVQPGPVEHEVNYRSGDSMNGSDNLPTITEDQAVNYKVRERSEHAMLVETGIEKHHQATGLPSQNFMTAMTPEMRQKIIEAFQKGSDVSQQSIHETADDVLQRTTKDYIDTAVGVVKFPVDVLVAAGKGLWGILEFERDLKFNPERAQETAGTAGDYIGKALVAGIRLWAAGTEYAFDVQQGGDYRQPFQDLGNTINSWYDTLTPGDQMHVMASISADFGIGAAAGQLRQLAKPGAFVQFLEETAQAVPKNSEAQERATETIKKLIQSITKNDELVTLEGVRIKTSHIDRPTANKPDTDMLMSKADDLEGLGQKHPEKRTKGDHVPENYSPPKWFAGELTKLIERLSPGEQTFISDHHIKIKPIQLVRDKFPVKGNLGACYDPSENTIYVAEKVLKLGKPVANYDLEFAFRHEFGHAYNAKTHQFGDYVSETPDFRTAFKQDIKASFEF